MDSSRQHFLLKSAVGFFLVLFCFDCSGQYQISFSGLILGQGSGNRLLSHFVLFNLTAFLSRFCFPQAEGKKLGLVGWVQNTDQGTVKGQLQGPVSKVRPMQEWLETKGSPKSHIDRANFNNEKVILKLDYSDFQIVK